MQYTKCAHSVIILPQCVTALDMKLIIILSVVACSYAAKLDRTYLPPASAATAGGTPGSLTAPGSRPNLPSGLSTFAQAVEQGFKSQSGPGFGTSGSQFQPGASGPQSGQPGVSNPGADGPSFGQAPSPFSGNQVSFGNQGPQDASTYSGQYQPKRAQASADRNSEILRSDSQNDGDNFAYSFETSNGITAEESGVATNGVQAQGGYSYTGDDGQQYRVTYTADENGYQPQGDHLPTPHPIPEEILRSLEENARAAAAGTQEGAYQPEEESNFGSQQYNNGASSAQSSGPQGYQYQAGSNQGPSPNAPTAPGFSFPRGQGPADQGPSPSTPTGTNVFAPSAPRQPTQNQGQFGTNSPAISGPGRQNQAQGPSGYQYSRPGDSSPFDRTNQAGQFAPQQTEAQPSGSFRPQSQGPSYSAPQGFGPNGPTGPSGPAQTPSYQASSPAQGPNARGQVNGPSFGPSGTSSGPAGSTQGSFSRPNSAQSYSPSGPSASPSTPQGSAFLRPSTSSTDNGYVYGPGISSSPNAKNSGQGFAPSGPSGPAGPSGSAQGFPSGSIGQGPASNLGFGPQGSRPTGTAQSPQGSAFPRPNGSVGSSIGGAQGPIGGAPQYQPAQPQGSAFPGPNGAFAPKAQGPFGTAPQYQPKQPEQAQSSPGPAFSRPTGPSVGPTGATFSSQGSFGTGSPSSGPKSSMPNQSAPYQYNRPGAQISQPGSAQNHAGSQPGFRTPEDRPGQNFGGPRQPPSFSSEEGYKY